jgi:GNAT superfamily N-acetyltransferase
MEARTYATEVLLRDGGKIHIRAVRPDDRQRLRGLFHSLSEQSIYSRFSTQKRELSEAELDFLTRLDFVQHVALAAVIRAEPQIASPSCENQEEQIIGVGRYAVQKDGNAEVAYAVADAHQHRGIGSALLQHLTVIARTAGLTTFVANVLTENVLLHSAFLARSGFYPTVTVSLGVAHISFPLGKAGHS